MGDTDRQGNPPALRGDEANLFREHHDRLVRSVARAVNAPAAVVEDACQTTWAILLRRQPERTERLFGWLRITAIYEVWRLSGQQRRDVWLEELRSEDGDWNEIFGLDAGLDERIEARRALEVLASLPERQRDDVSLVIGGYSYREIQDRTPGRTFTNVNKHIAKGRARIRRIEAEAAR
jgi:DNA-directed RNA polymerase specialized sigma24 family protein